MRCRTHIPTDTMRPKIDIADIALKDIDNSCALRLHSSNIHYTEVHSAEDPQYGYQNPINTISKKTSNFLWVMRFVHAMSQVSTSLRPRGGGKQRHLLIWDLLKAVESYKIDIGLCTVIEGILYLFGPCMIEPPKSVLKIAVFCKHC
jgi:hypothetical protein